MCNEADLTYEIAPVAGADFYTWYVPSGSEILSGQGSTLIQVTLGGYSGDICVIANNGCGNSLVRCISVDVPSFVADAGDCAYVYAGAPPFDCIDLSASVTGGVPPFSFVWTTPT